VSTQTPLARDEDCHGEEFNFIINFSSTGDSRCLINTEHRKKGGQRLET